VRPGKDKTQAVKEITELRTMKQLKSFIGLANYFRSDVKGFARVAGNLHALTKQGLKITSGPSRRIHAVLFGLLQNSERGNMYILVITDKFTKKVQLTPINGKDAATVMRAMMNDMYTFGVPHTVVTDQGPEFVSHMQNILFDSLNIDRKVTTG
jgi:hypothetical protein